MFSVVGGNEAFQLFGPVEDGAELRRRAVLERLEERGKTRYVSPLEIATVYAGLGDLNQSFEWLEKAYQERTRKRHTKCSRPIRRARSTNRRSERNAS